MSHTGIDVHDKDSQIQLIQKDGTKGIKTNVPTTRECFNTFLNALDAPTSITIEAGRNYWWLHYFFSNHAMVSNTNVVDPRRSRNLAEELSVKCGFGRAKNDNIDANMLAEQDRRGLTPNIHVPTLEQLENRALVRHRTDLVVLKTALCNKIYGHFALRGIPVGISRLCNERDYQQKVLSNLKDFTFSPLIIKNLIATIQLFGSQIGVIEEALDKILPCSHPQMKLLLSAPGIGIVLARIMYTEILDIKYFKEPKYLMSYSGLAPVEHISHGKKGPIRLNRYSNHYLKYAFVEAAHHARTHPRYRRKYDLDVKKHGKIRAKLNLARRLTKTVYWMMIRQQPFKF